MSMKNILSCLGGYFNSTKFELDIPKIAEVVDLTEDEITSELNDLQNTGDIVLNDDNSVELINITTKVSKKFNDLYAPVETLEWKPGMKLKLDK